MTELECKENIKRRMQDICQRHEDLEPLDEDERYIFMSIEYLNVHESLGRNIHEFLDLTDNLRRGTVHTIYTPTEEAEICLICPLKECKNSECERFKEEKRKLKGK